MLIRAFVAVMMILMLGLGQSGSADAAMYANKTVVSLDVIGAGPVDHHQHGGPTRTGGEGHCSHGSVPCSPTFLFQRNSALELRGTSHLWATPIGDDLKPITLKRDPPIPRHLR